MKHRDVWGVILLAVGVLLLLNALNVFSVNIFFNGWWTLFLIIPAIISIRNTGITLGNTVLFVLGVGLLLNEQGWNIRGYLLPVILIVLGIVVIFRK